MKSHTNVRILASIYTTELCNCSQDFLQGNLNDIERSWNWKVELQVGGVILALATIGIGELLQQQFLELKCEKLGEYYMDQ